jgi:aminoglycoside/choline kinase family phosphotransferase
MSDRGGSETDCAVGSKTAIAAAPDSFVASRRAALSAFLGSCGLGGGTPVPLAADASFRSYYRVRRGRRRAVVMDAPPPREDVTAFAAIATVLRNLGLSAPRVLGEDRARGFLLLEDFGDDTYRRLLANGADEHALYALAVDTLVALQRAVASGEPPDLPAYDEKLLLAEAVLLVDWYLPAVLGAPLDGGLRKEYLELWRPVLAQALTPCKPTLVLRDFHIDNLVLLRRRRGVRRCGLLDFQDAVCGPPSYDLVSLTADARRDVSEELAEAMTLRYLAGFPQFDRPAFIGSAAIFAVQRNCKVLGIFTRLWRRDRKPGYLVHIPRLWRLVERDLGHPSLAPIRQWLDRRLPSDARRVPDVRLPP